MLKDTKITGSDITFASYIDEPRAKLIFQMYGRFIDHYYEDGVDLFIGFKKGTTHPFIVKGNFIITHQQFMDISVMKHRTH